MTYKEIDEDDKLYVDFLNERSDQLSVKIKEVCASQMERGCLEALDDAEVLQVLVATFLLESFTLCRLYGMEEKIAKDNMIKMIQAIRKVSGDDDVH